MVFRSNSELFPDAPPNQVIEVRPDCQKAEWLIEMTESGRGRVIRHVQSQKRQSGIVLNCDGVSKKNIQKRQPHPEQKLTKAL
jgi:hypothetical protein